METLTALGTILGPMIGQVLYSALGGQIPFYVLSFLFFCCLFTIRWLPPDNRAKKDLVKVSSVKCLSDRYIFMTFLVLVGGTTAQTYINTLYSKHMDNLGLDDDTSGYVFSVGSIFYMLFLHFMPKLSKYVNRKLILTVGIFISIIGTEVQAPEKYLGLPSGGKSWYIVTIGQCIINIAFAMCVLPMIPELIQLTVEKELKERNIQVADPKLTRACSDMSSGIFMAGYSLGLFIGPFGSGVLYDTFEGDDIEKFMNTSRCIAAFLLLCFILYLTVGGSYKGFKIQSKIVRSLSKKSQKFNENVIRDRDSKQVINSISFGKQEESNKDSEIISSSELKDGLINQLDKRQQSAEDFQEQKVEQQNQENLDVDSDILLSDDNDDDKEHIISEGKDSYGDDSDTIMSFEVPNQFNSPPSNVNREHHNQEDNC